MNDHPALVACDRCPHPRATHAPTDDAPCRIGGCPCPGFESEQLTPVVEDERPKTVTVTIPDGFGFSISFWPVVEESTPSE